MTPTPTGQGPAVLHFGVVTRSDGCVFCCEPACSGEPTPTPEFDSFGRQVFEVPPSQFIIVVEAARGTNGLSVAAALTAQPPDGRPDLQIQSVVPLGNGSVEICDTGQPPSGGGVPAISPPSFAPGDPFVTAALLDFACRFQVFPRSGPCTIIDASGQFGYIESAATIQFCSTVAAMTAAFPPGDAILSVRVRDVGGETGPEAQIVLRVRGPS